MSSDSRSASGSGGGASPNKEGLPVTRSVNTLPSATPLRRQSQSGWDPLLVRTGPSTAEYRRGGGEKNVEPIRNLTPQRLALHAFGFNEQPLDVARVVTALTKLEVHVPFDVHPAWTQTNAYHPTVTPLCRTPGQSVPMHHVLRPTMGGSPLPTARKPTHARLAPTTKGGGQCMCNAIHDRVTG